MADRDHLPQGGHEGTTVIGQPQEAPNDKGRVAARCAALAVVLPGATLRRLPTVAGEKRH